jgi:hypothetical protein
MSGINATISNIAELIVTLYPGFIILFLLVVSVFNYTIIKGIIYFSGILVCHVIWMLLVRVFPDNERNPNAPITCDVINFPSLNYNIPNRPTIITCFTLIYLLLPMFNNITTLFNPIIIFVLSFFTLSNMIYQYQNDCSNGIGVIFGAIIGLILGLFWFLVFWAAGKKDLLFYNELASNNVVCSKPSKQTFKCRVYKNGEIVSSDIS